MKKLACLSILLLATACGGGSGGDPGANTTPNPNPNPNPLTESELVQQLLDGCGLSSIQDFQEFFDLLVGLFSPGAPAPAFNIPPSSINILNTSFGWGLDVSSPPDGSDDLTGTIALRDASNNPTLAGLSLTDFQALLAGDLNNLPTILAGVDAGTRFVIAFSGTPPSNAANTTISGNLTLVMGAAGALDSSSGSLTSTVGADCTSTVSWTDLDISGVTAAGQLPSGTMALVVTTAAATLNGTITLDGTNIATIDAARTGQPTQSYTLDLGTGTLTPL